MEQGFDAGANAPSHGQTHSLQMALRRLTFVLFAPFVVQLCLDRTLTCKMWNQGLDAEASRGSWAMVAPPLGPGQLDRYSS
jgi:hypothetical protein